MVMLLLFGTVRETQFKATVHISLGYLLIY